MTVKFSEELIQHLKKNYLNDEVLQIHRKDVLERHLENLLLWLSKPPLTTCLRVNTLKITRSEAKTKLEEFLEKQYSQRNYQVLEHPEVPDVLLIPSPESKTLPFSGYKQVIVDCLCGVAVLRGSNIYAPGILGADSGIIVGDLVSVFADLDGKCRKGLTQSYEGNKLFLGNGKALLSRRNIFVDLVQSGTAIEMTEPLYNCPSLGSVLPDIFLLQNLPSVICGHVLNPKPGDWVLDMCSSPGGKMSHLATLMKNQGKLIAIDKTQSKVNKVLINSSRFGITCVDTFVYDSTKIVDTSKAWFKRNDNNAVGPGAPPYPPCTFDCILLDAPCSALGQRPQLQNNTKLNQLLSFPPLQKKLFATAVQLLRDDGVLVYSTCTLTLSENEELVKWALGNFPEIKLSPQIPYLGLPGLIGAGLSEEERNLVQRFEFPFQATVQSMHCDSTSDSESVLTYASNSTDLNAMDSIGFFIAKFIKKSS